MAYLVTIEPVEEPADFRNVRFTKADWEKAVKIGQVRDIPYPTAKENIKNSGGLYRIKPAPKPTVEHIIQGLKAPEEMTSAELVAEMTSHGKPPRKKMQRPVAIDFVKKLRAEAEAMILDDEDEGSEED